MILLVHDIDLDLEAHQFDIRFLDLDCGKLTMTS